MSTEPGQLQLQAQHVSAWEQARNEVEDTAHGRFTTADARIRLRKLYPTIHA